MARGVVADVRRIEREARRQKREIELQMKQLAKLNALEQARLEVAAFENEVEILRSIHKDVVPPVDWRALAAALVPHPPSVRGAHEGFAVLKGIFGVDPAREALDEARAQDALEHEVRRQAWIEECRIVERSRSLACRVLARELAAYGEALVVFSGLGEMEQLGSRFETTVHSVDLVECRLVINGWSAIPSQMLSLTATGKKSTKAMPKARFYELYQDYACSCVLRAAREVLAVLPIEAALITASVLSANATASSGNVVPIVSVLFPRARVDELPFDTLDPSDALGGFFRRGDARPSRSSGEFIPISPLGPHDLEPLRPLASKDLTSALASVRKLRAEISGLRETFDRKEG